MDTTREDYSPDGTAWEYFPHDHACSRATLGAVHRNDLGGERGSDRFRISGQLRVLLQYVVTVSRRSCERLRQVERQLVNCPHASWPTRLLGQRLRGVSDHIRGSRHDRPPGQISWSLTPRYCH
jgi:hypothetical protein